MDQGSKRSGFCALAGRSNVGKSTLLNALIGTKIAITSPKAQTTRFPIRGILNRPQGQIVFVDTPGIFLERGRSELTKQVNRNAESALSGVDVILYIVDPTRAPGKEEHFIRNLVLKSPAKKILVLNKIDEKRTPWREEYLLEGDDFGAVIELSAKKGTNLGFLIEKIFSLLPENEPLYPEGQFSDLSHEIWLAEIIREKIFLLFRQEVPYSVSVRIDKIEERPHGIYAIFAIIEVADERYKPIIIGKGGRMLRQIGINSRKELEGALQRKVFLSLEVEVNKYWHRRLET